MKLAILDIDNTLLRYDLGFQDYMITQGHVIERNDTYDLQEQFPSVGCNKRMMALIESFSASEEFGKLKPANGAKELVNKLSKEGYTLTAISSYLPEPALLNAISETLRLANISREFPEIERVVSQPLFASKVDAIKELAEGYSEVFFVDDSAGYIEDALSTGVVTDCAIWDQPYNRGYHNCKVRRIIGGNL